MHRPFQFITPPENSLQVPFRIVSTLIVRLLVRTQITPDQVTIARTVIVIPGLYLFAVGGASSLPWAVAVFYLFEVLDHVDGDLARFSGRVSQKGALLEQFVDTWAARPSNVFGFCVAFGMHNETGQVTGFVLFGFTVLGRLLWLEYRDYFGWDRDKLSQIRYRRLLSGSSLPLAFRTTFEVLYIWNNTFLLMGALAYGPAKTSLGIDTLIVGFGIVALLNNVPWVAIVVRGFRQSASTQ